MVGYLRWRLGWLFAEYIAKNGRHLGDAIHKWIAGLNVTTKLQTFRSKLKKYHFLKRVPVETLQCNVSPITLQRLTNNTATSHTNKKPRQAHLPQVRTKKVRTRYA